MIRGLIIIALALSYIGCKQARPEREQVAEPKIKSDTTTPVQIVPAGPAVKESDYYIISRDSFKTVRKKFSTHDLNLVAALNRIDEEIMLRSDSLVLPRDYSLAFYNYFPFPQTLPFLQEVNKIIIFSNPSQSFAAYRRGVLEITGPTSMGKAGTPTPRGLFFTNWKAERTVSTVNPKWILRWNFNAANKKGIGFHQYQLPGYPASHSCMRLREEDARFLYTWADQWILKNANSIAGYGTPVIVYGKYPYGKRRPWRNLAEDAGALAIDGDSLQIIIQPFLEEILQKQRTREDLGL